MKIERSYRLPLPEVSGLAGVVWPGAELQLYAVGDRSYEIARFWPGRRQSAGNLVVEDVRGLLPERPPSSQWEAVAVDGPGGVCAVSEDTSRVTCLSGDLRTLRGVFDLDLGAVEGLAGLWAASKNSGAEGMVLMRHGHLLLLKEKHPSLLVELGPPGSSAFGWTVESALALEDPFDLPRSGGLVALKRWSFSDRLSQVAKDASDLTVGPDGRLYLLSQRSGLVARLEDRLGPEQDEVSMAAVWRLPEGLQKAEGLVIDSGMSPWVGLDLKERSEGPNLFRLTSLQVGD